MGIIAVPLYKTGKNYFVLWLHENHPVQQIGDNVVLYDLTQIRGTNALLRRIPRHTGGVYAWYRRFEFEPTANSDPEVFTTSIINELRKAHCTPREARLPPSHRIMLQSDTSFSKGDELKELAVDPSFRQLLLMLLENSLLFQQPLYIGKATDLHSRIQTHLREGGILRERFAAAGHNIHRSRLLLIHILSNTSNLGLDNIDDEEEIDNQIDTEDIEFSESLSERLIEDILSRLFVPPFTLRYG
jgi:hypothetical protein